METSRLKATFERREDDEGVELFARVIIVCLSRLPTR